MSQQMIHTCLGDMTSEEVDELLECGTIADRIWEERKQMELEHSLTDREIMSDKIRNKTMLS